MNGKIEKKLDKFYELWTVKHPGDDPWGLNLQHHKKFLKCFNPLYQHYFKTRIYGNEKVEDRPYMVVANHSGQLPWDALILMHSFMTELSYPHLLRGMAERFVGQLPFISKIATEALGAVLGDRQNCLHLLQRKQSILVFPEGVQGISKNTEDFYKLRTFPSGFFRLAISAQVPILPVAIVGAEEFYPWVLQVPKVAKLLKTPSFFMTPFFPWLGPLGLIPFPSSIEVHIGDPVFSTPELDAEAPDSDLFPLVHMVQQSIQKMIDDALIKRKTGV